MNLNESLSKHSSCRYRHVRHFFFRWPSRAVVRQEFPRLGKNLKKSTLQVSWIAWVLIFVRHSLTFRKRPRNFLAHRSSYLRVPTQRRASSKALRIRSTESCSFGSFFGAPNSHLQKRSLEMACIEMENRHVLRLLGRPCLGSLFRHIPLRLSYAYVLYRYELYGWFTCIPYRCRILNDA